MAFKLYDFKDPELDEQVRLICDLLYNKREDYPGQMSPPVDASALREHLWWAKPTGSKPTGQLITSSGVVITGTSPSTRTDQSTASETTAEVASALIGTRAGWTPGSAHDIYDAGGGTNAPFNYGPYLFQRIKLQYVADLRFRIVMGNASSPANNDNPWGAASTTTGGLAFNFLPAVSPNWFAVGKLFGTTTLQFNVDLTVPVIANQIYNLEIVVKGQDTARAASFWIDGINYYTVIGNTSYSANTGVLTSWSIDLYPLVATTKQTSLFRAVWGARTSIAYPAPHGYRNWTGQE